METNTVAAILPEAANGKKSKRKPQRRERGIREIPEGSGIWYVTYADGTRLANGRPRIRFRKAGSYANAVKLRHKVKTAANEDKLAEVIPPKRRQVTFTEIADAALKYKEGKPSYRSDVFRIKQLKEWFGSHFAASLKWDTIEARLFEQETEGEWAHSTYNKYRSLMSLAYRLAIKRKEVIYNPIGEVEQREEDNSRVRFLTVPELDKLRKNTPPEHLPKIDLAFHLGLRKGNQFRLRWVDVDLPSRRLVVGRTKNGEVHYKRLNNSALAAFMAQEQLSRGSEWVFPSPDDSTKPLSESGCRKWFATALKKAGIVDFHWHDWRHTGASHLAMNGASLKEIMEFLGHKTVVMANRYTHLSPEYQLKTVGRLDDVFDTSGRNEGRSEQVSEQTAETHVIVN
jgi:integrase